MSTKQMTVQELANEPALVGAEQTLKLTGFGAMIAGLALPTMDADARTVTTHVHAMADANGVKQYGAPIAVYATAGGTTGPCSIVPGTPATTEVKLEFLADGQPKLTFNTSDAVTACKVYWVNTGTYRGNSMYSNLTSEYGVG